MSPIPSKCLVDTNVPIVANQAHTPNSVPLECVMACMEAITNVTSKGVLVIDSGDEIFREYLNNLSLSGQPGVGDLFFKWVHDNRWMANKIEQVDITPDGYSYREFPDHKSLSSFDNSDRKFVAVANSHPEKPPILQATDSKWWGWSEALEEVKIRVEFLCPDYIKDKYNEKMGPRRGNWFS